MDSGKNCRLLLFGDTAQLPPVGLNISPALDSHALERRGYDVFECTLTDVVRQEKDSGILLNATELRKIIASGIPGLPAIAVKNFPDVVRLSGNTLIEEIESAYSKYGENETLIVSRSNKRANRYNEGIRNQILWREEALSIGDMLMIVKNNYFWIAPEEKLDFIANGEIVKLEAIRKYYDLHGFRFADVSISFADYDKLSIDARIMIDTLRIDSASLTSDRQREFFQQVWDDYEEEKTKKSRMKKVLEDPFFNALQVKFSYAVTCHKAQGGQWKAVFIDPGFINEDQLDIEALRWLYTAFTRASEKLFLVNFPEKWFLVE